MNISLSKQHKAALLAGLAIGVVLYLMSPSLMWLIDHAPWVFIAFALFGLVVWAKASVVRVEERVCAVLDALPGSCEGISVVQLHEALEPRSEDVSLGYIRALVDSLAEGPDYEKVRSSKNPALWVYRPARSLELADRVRAVLLEASTHVEGVSGDYIHKCLSFSDESSSLEEVERCLDELARTPEFERVQLSASPPRWIYCTVQRPHPERFERLG